MKRMLKAMACGAALVLALPVHADGNGELSRMEYLEHMTKQDFRELREKTADFIEPGDDDAASGGSR